MIRRGIRDAIIAVTITAAVTKMLKGLRQRMSRQHSEELLDESLIETFPASDPPASQHFDIPGNRQ